jgi:hypothetical protein
MPANPIGGGDDDTARRIDAIGRRVTNDNAGSGSGANSDRRPSMVSKDSLETGLVTAGRSQTDIEPVNTAAPSTADSILMILVLITAGIMTVWQ